MSIARLHIFIVNMVIILCLTVCGNCISQNAVNPGNQKHWIGTWATSVQTVEPKLMPEEHQKLDNRTIRQVVRVSCGGNTISIRFSNAFADWRDNLETGEAYIAVSAGGSSIVPGSLKQLTFSGKTNATIPYGTIMVSDPIEFALKPGSDLVITIYVSKSPSKISGHRSARGEVVYIQSGNAAKNERLESAAANKCWYFLSGVDILTEDSNASIVCLGDSITDGKGSTEGDNCRWPDYLARRLQANEGTKGIGILNQGIGGNCLIYGGIGQPVMQRMDRDVLSQPGAKWVIILEGINDLGGGQTSAEDIITSYKQIIYRCKSCGMKVIGSTILPCGESFYYQETLEAKRLKINKWIRTSGEFDKVIDWDAVVRDPENPAKLLPIADSGDHLHLSDEGYRLMAEAIALTWFENQE